jgi:hypothetical protein
VLGCGHHLCASFVWMCLAAGIICERCVCMCWAAGIMCGRRFCVCGCVAGGRGHHRCERLVCVGLRASCGRQVPLAVAMHDALQYVSKVLFLRSAFFCLVTGPDSLVSDESGDAHRVVTPPPPLTHMSAVRLVMHALSFCMLSLGAQCVHVPSEAVSIF